MLASLVAAAVIAFSPVAVKPVHGRGSKMVHVGPGSGHKTVNHAHGHGHRRGR